MSTAPKNRRTIRRALLPFVLIAVHLLAPHLPAQPVPASLGDLDTSGVVAVRALFILYTHVNRSPPLFPELLPSAALNGASFVNQPDVALLADVILGFPFPFKPATFNPANGASEVGEGDEF